MGVTVLTKSRWWSGKSSGGSGRLDGRVIEDGGDTYREVWLLTLKTIGWTVSGFGHQNLGAVLEGIGGGTWWHHEACVKMKQSGEGHVAVGSAELRVRP